MTPTKLLVGFSLNHGKTFHLLWWLLLAALKMVAPLSVLRVSRGGGILALETTMRYIFVKK